MHIKIYFNSKPLFLCDSITEEVAPYIHQEDSIYIDEFSQPAVNSMIHEMQSDEVHAGIFLHDDLNKLRKTFWKKFIVIQAAGGLVLNQQQDILFIFRRGKWDLPKGKLEPGESLEECAVREVEEETGLKGVILLKFLQTTYHTYHESGKHILKETFWYLMDADGTQDTSPQIAEDISEIRWVKKANLPEILKNTFPLIIDVVYKFGDEDIGR